MREGLDPKCSSSKCELGLGGEMGDVAIHFKKCLFGSPHFTLV